MASLLFLRYCILRNFLRHLTRQDYVRFAILGGLFGLVIAAGAMFATYGFSFILDLPAMGEVVTESLVELLFFILFHLLIISNLLLGYTYLFHSRRAHLYFSFPLQAGTVFLLRGGEAILQSSWASFVLVGAVLISYGISAGASLPYFLLLPVTLCAFLLLCGVLGLTAAFLLGLLRQRFGRKVFYIGGAVLIILGTVYLAGQVRLLSFKPGEELIFFTRLTGRLQAMGSPFWPGKWATNAIMAFSRTLYAEGFFAVGLLAATAIGTWPILDLLGRHVYLELWQNLSIAGGRARKRARPPSSRRPLVGTIRKDLLLFVRDPAQSLQLILFILLMALYAVSLLRFPRGVLPDQYTRYVALANVAAISFILGSFSSRFVYPLLGIEGRAIWIFAAAPLTPRVILLAKLLMGYLIMAPAAVGLAVTSQLALGIEGHEFLLSALLVAGLSLALATLSLGFSAAFAEFTSDRPGEVLGTMGGTANFLASSGLAVVVVGLWSLGVVLGRTSPAGMAAIGAAFFVIASVIIGGYLWALRSFRGREY